VGAPLPASSPEADGRGPRRNGWERSRLSLPDEGTKIVTWATQLQASTSQAISLLVDHISSGKEINQIKLNQKANTEPVPYGTNRFRSYKVENGFRPQ
jgi:hypothetical protein